MTIFNHESPRPMHYKRWLGSILLGLTTVTLVGCGSQQEAKSNAASSSDSTPTSRAVKSSAATDSSESKTSSRKASPSDASSSTAHLARSSNAHPKDTKQSTAAKQSATDSSLADLNYRSGQPAVTNVNGGHSTLDPASWKVNNVEYANLDGLNRTSAGNTADLASQNVANDSLRTSQTFKPTGYKQKFINNEPILNRGHEIAYSLSKGISTNGRYEPNVPSGDQNNPKNLFTQTAFSNQKVQTIYESQVRNALRQGKKVIYQVQPVFAGNDLMAKGVHMQALATDRSLDYNVYLYNVQPGMNFDYATGRSTVDHDMNVPTPAGAPTFRDDNSNRSNAHATNERTSRRNTGVYRKKHHYVRDAVALGAAHHVIKHHYQKKYQPTRSHHLF